jgi:hypothetical protein
MCRPFPPESEALEMNRRIKVVFIMGYGHSGSTLLDILLGSHDHITSVGEMVHYDPMSSVRHNLCACGEKHSQCPYWVEVSKHFKSFVPDAKTFFPTVLKKKFDNWRSLLCWIRLLRRIKNPSQEYREYCRHLVALFNAISMSSNSSIIVDSSKSPCRAATLAGLNDAIDLRIIHLMRDGRGVCWSMMKRIRYSNDIRFSKIKQLIAFIRAMIGWTATNLAAECIVKMGVGGEHYLRIRYEDLVEDHEAFFKQVGIVTGESMHKPMMAISSGIELDIGHMAGGNPFRMRKKVVFNPDYDWCRNLPLGYQKLFGVVCGRVLKRYGYASHYTKQKKTQ